MFFPWLPFCGFHSNSFCRASKRTKATGGTAFTPLFIPVQYLHATKNGRKRTLLLRVIYCRSFLKKMTKSNSHAFEYGWQVQFLPNRHRVPVYLFTFIG